ncbi:hypothetical protein DOT_2918 [Desulfosporosinus sp. OT]|nr:hypothetical protein DOT_2918 [Desulfosporosinus sp. OT]
MCECRKCKGKTKTCQCKDCQEKDKCGYARIDDCRWERIGGKNGG